jgi:uncharacterized LabA/DUF88 family protein
MSKPQAADKLRREGLVPKSVAVFIDGLNVRFRLKECGWQELYDVGHLAESLCGRRKLVGIFFYHPPPNREQLGASRYALERAYLERIRKDIGVVIPRGSYMAKRAQTRQGLTATFWVEKQTDVLLASDLVYFAAKGLMDAAVVVSADADIVPAIRRCRELGVSVELLRFRGAVPRLYALEKVSTSLRRARPGYFRPY